MRIFLSGSNRPVVENIFSKLKSGDLSSTKPKLITEWCSAKAFVDCMATLVETGKSANIVTMFDKLVGQTFKCKEDALAKMLEGAGIKDTTRIAMREATATEFLYAPIGIDAFENLPGKDKFHETRQDNELGYLQRYFNVITSLMIFAQRHADTHNLCFINSGWLDFYNAAKTNDTILDYFQPYLNEFLPYNNHPNDIHIHLQTKDDVALNVSQVDDRLGLYTDNVHVIDVPEDYEDTNSPFFYSLGELVKGLEEKSKDIFIGANRQEIYSNDL